MDGFRISAWTRRRVGFAAGGLATTLAGLATGNAADAKRKRCKKKEKRCGKKCVKGNCCPGKSCGATCTCERTLDGKTFCAATTVKIVCAQCESDADCGEPFRCVRTEPADCGPAITASCAVPCGFVFQT